MRSLFVTFLIIFLSSVSFAGERYIITGENIAKLKQNVLRNRGEVIKDLKLSKSFVAIINKEILNSLKRDFGNTVFVEKDIIFSIDKRGGGRGGVPQQPAQTIPWGVSRIHATTAQITTKGAGVKVCVVDTGADFDHPDLKANIIGGVNTINSRKSAKDDNGHGTHVSGTIAALDNSIGVVGVAPEAKIFAVKGLDRNGSGWASDLAEGIYECIYNGTSIINMSWGSSQPSITIHNALIDASNAGLILVAAAGNESSAVGYPAAFQEVIAVSAVDSNMQFAYFSNYGPEIVFAAPGVDIESTIIGGGYARWNGTSMATPHVVGVAALMLSVGSLGLLGEDIGLGPYFQGSGLIDAFATINNF